MLAMQAGNVTRDGHDGGYKQDAWKPMRFRKKWVRFSIGSAK